jgi:hypothetical protein
MKYRGWRSNSTDCPRKTDNPRKPPSSHGRRLRPRKTVTYVGLVVVMSTAAGMFYGNVIV